MQSLAKNLAIAYIVWAETIRRKDFYVLLILLGTLLVLLTLLPIFGLGGITQYVADVGLLATWTFSVIFTIAVSCRQLPHEETRGTIFSLLAKPVSRFEIIVGKWLGAWSVVSTATLAFYVLVALFVSLKGGTIFYVMWMQGFILHICALAIISSMGIALSTRLNYDASATIAYIISAISLLLLPRIPELVAANRGLKGDIWLFIYNVLPHLEIFDLRRGIVHDFPAVATKWIILCMIYAVFWTLAFLLLAWIAYNRKPFSRVNVE